MTTRSTKYGSVKLDTYGYGIEHVTEAGETSGYETGWRLLEQHTFHLTEEQMFAAAFPGFESGKSGDVGAMHTGSSMADIRWQPSDDEGYQVQLFGSLGVEPHVGRAAARLAAVVDDVVTDPEDHSYEIALERDEA